MLKIAGDICLTDNYFDIGYGVGSSIIKGSIPFRKLQKKDSDVWVGNCECVISDFSVYSNYRKYCFRISPIHLYPCRFIDYYCVANNHVMEHGAEAYRDTCNNLLTLSKGYFGSKEQRTISFEHQSQIVSITSFSLRKDSVNFEPLYWCFPELDEIEEEYKKLDSDFKIVYLHWGVEFINFPHIEQIRLAHWLIDLGFDLVIGLHPHILQGYEIYKRKYIFYSLGNFVFDMGWRPTSYSAIVSVDLSSQKVLYHYVKIDSSFHPQIVSVDNVPEKYRFEYLNALIGQINNVEEYIKHSSQGLKKYRRFNRTYFVGNIYRNKFHFIGSILIDFVKRKLHL